MAEGDILLDKRYLDRVLADTVRFRLNPEQWRSNNTVQFPEYHNVDISNLSSRADWYQAALEAIAEWNNLSGTLVRMSSDYCPTCHSRTVMSFYEEACVPNTPCTLAWAYLPQDGKPGNTVKINLGFNIGLGPNGQPTALAKRRTLVHELGHTVGFRHTNWQGTEYNSGGYNLIPGTPETDWYSVMNGGTANEDWYGFSYWDRVSSRVLYKGWGPKNQVGEVVSARPKISWTSAQDAVEYRVYYTPAGYCTSYEEGGMTYYDCWPGSPTTLVGTTTSTTFTDLTRSATSVTQCSTEKAHYTVTTVFPVSGESLQAAERWAYGACFH